MNDQLTQRISKILHLGALIKREAKSPTGPVGSFYRTSLGSLRWSISRQCGMPWSRWAGIQTRSIPRYLLTLTHHSIQVDASGLVPNALELNLDFEYQQEYGEVLIPEMGAVVLLIFVVPWSRDCPPQVNLEWIGVPAREENGIWLL